MICCADLWRYEGDMMASRAQRLARARKLRSVAAVLCIGLTATHTSRIYQKSAVVTADIEVLAPHSFLLDLALRVRNAPCAARRRVVSPIDYQTIVTDLLVSHGVKFRYGRHAERPASHTQWESGCLRRCRAGLALRMSSIVQLVHYTTGDFHKALA